VNDDADRLFDDLSARLRDPTEPEAGPDRSAGRVATVLDALGWRSASEMPTASVAPGIALMLEAFGRHGDMARLRRGIAEHLRQHAHALDGSHSPTAAWEPTAAELIARLLGRR
jgi:hypothetical protein